MKRYIFEFLGCILPSFIIYYIKGVDVLNINIENLISISEANQNFSKVTRLVDEKGTAVILKNNAPRYVLLDYNVLMENNTASDSDVDTIASRILLRHLKAFEELAK